MTLKSSSDGETSSTVFARVGHPSLNVVLLNVSHNSVHPPLVSTHLAYPWPYLLAFGRETHELAIFHHWLDSFINLLWSYLNLLCWFRGRSMTHHSHVVAKCLPVTVGLSTHVAVMDKPCDMSSLYVVSHLTSPFCSLFTQLTAVGAWWSLFRHRIYLIFQLLQL